MKLGAKVLAAASGLGLAAAMLATVPANADTSFSATIQGKSGSLQDPVASTLKNLKHTSTQTVTINNLPQGVGLYLLHCLIPTGQGAPTLCDASDKALVYIPPMTDATTQVLEQKLEVNAEFYGQNPNPQAGSTTNQTVDCREPAQNNYGAACAIYVLGSGKDSANPTYMRMFPTQFKDVKPRKNDKAKVKVAGKVIGKGQKPTLKYEKQTSLNIKMKSGIKPDLQSDNCTINNKGTKIQANASSGTCQLLITTPGNTKYNIFVRTVTFKLTVNR